MVRLYRVVWKTEDGRGDATAWASRDEAFAAWGLAVATPGVLNPTTETSDPIFKQYVQVPAGDEGKEEPGHV